MAGTGQQSSHRGDLLDRDRGNQAIDGARFGMGALGALDCRNGLGWEPNTVDQYN